ncbi:hypothetical protein IEQ34_015004 [Dendrobium chrysotoxum]|uniref:Protein kinase domain-containing protein n=1 Tax=Dendrobium chrysotoxum TaxID=161865 RepID=A0AAV7GNJ5_DENCH|nr:hypothetical protein IEQ34_015004 [Dendrobium chrysotoxum]
MKIALGAARALAYLHEASDPCIIHRDFKDSNALLEEDFTPRVSDFGLARKHVIVIIFPLKSWGLLGPKG